MSDYENLNVSLKDQIAHIEINNPEKANSLNAALWKEIKEVFEWVDQNREVRVAILSGAGKHYCAGIDLGFLVELNGRLEAKDEARKSEQLRQIILELQETFNAIEKCRKPVIAAIHSACIGGGVDMITACDIRYCSQDAYFCIKEIDMGMTADVGTLQRLPHIIGDGVMRELAYTGRNVLAKKAKEIGLVNQVFKDKEELIKEATQIALEIAAKSPLAIRGTKEMILYTRDHTVTDSLNYIATWNGGMLQSNDLQEAMMAQMEKRPPKFEN